MSKNNLKNLKKDDFKIFFDLILPCINLNNNNHRDNLPLIPQIYFKNNNSIIDQYYRIKVKLDKLKKTKELLFFILNSEKDNFEKITISKEKNKLYERNLIPEFIEAKKYILSNSVKGLRSFEIKEGRTSVAEGTDIILKSMGARKYGYPDTKICLFLNKFKENKNILKTASSVQSHAYEIFNNEYFGKYKNYFLKIFNEYERLRTDLFNEINSSNFGIMAFEYFFDLSSYEKLKNHKNELLQKLNISKSSNSEYNKINYDKFIYSNNNVNNNALEENMDTKSKLMMKISECNILYTNFNNISYIKSNYKTMITKLYANINNNISTYVGNNSKNNLYDILKSAIDTDFFLIKFLCNYIDPDLFNKIIDNDFKIKNYIRSKINKFESYYDEYYEWFKRATNDGEEHKEDSFGKLINFDDFFKEQFHEFLK